MLENLKKKTKTENVSLELIIFYILKTIYQKIKFSPGESKIILFVVGCQRSGTSLMTRVFFRDIRAKVYRESSILSSQDPFKLRLNHLALVKNKLAMDKASLIILKPLVESQNILKILEMFPGSYAVWLFRNFKGVVNSNLKMFGMNNGINDLRPIVENNGRDWRCENISSFTRSIVKKYYSPKMSQYDAAALFWYVRNQIFFDLDLSQNSRILMCRYEDLVTSPEISMERIYNKIGLSYPENKLTKEVHDRSVKKGVNVMISNDIENLCSEMLKKLQESYIIKMGQFHEG